MFNRKPSAARQNEFTPYDLWGSGGWCNQEVVGESHYLPALKDLFPHGGSRRGEIDTTALLTPEPANRHDPNAVAVQIDGAIVGYLPREVAATHHRLLAQLADRGTVARVPCRIWGEIYTDYDYDRSGRSIEKQRFNASVTIALAEPHLCHPVNAPPPEQHVILPDGGAIQVSGEDAHMPTITPLLRPEGECFVYTTLHEIEQQAGRTTKELVEVRLDGGRVGQLTPKMSSDLLPAIRHLERVGHLTVSKAKLRGNQLKAELTLQCARAHELPADWPQGIGVARREVSTPLDANDGPRRHAAVPPKPTRISFAAPPGWPPVPEGWEPPLGWQPDPSWATAPEGWKFWVVD